ncbi:DNA polymerase epsilon subunit B, partial [Bienertia sinuspersici]
IDANGQNFQSRRGKNKRFWKKEDEKALINCLLELTIPHIESKFKWFKDKYTVVSDMVNKTSGFQWDVDNKMIKCERQPYEDFSRIILKQEDCGRLLFPILTS